MFFIHDLELCFLDNGAIPDAPAHGGVAPAHQGAESAHKAGQRATRIQDETLGGDFKAKH
jgi:hypothetical protein